MKIKKPVLIVLGEPNSIFVEILSKTLMHKGIRKKINYPIFLIGSKKLILAQLKYLKKNIDLTILEKNKNNLNKLKNKIYLINVNYRFKKPFEKVSTKSKGYISKCFEIAFELLNSKKSDVLINGPIDKKYFLRGEFPGITEYVYKKSKNKISKKSVMLIFNKLLSVSPVTTHISLKDVSKNIKKNAIINNINTVNNFYKVKLYKKPKIAVLGLNPHCESKYKSNEEKNIIIPAIKKTKNKGVNVSGPFSADTFFLKKNISYYDSIIGMYHDQVLTPFKTLFDFDASNITLGLPFLRMSVDHGPNESMLGKNKSNTKSLENIFNFISYIR